MLIGDFWELIDRLLFHACKNTYEDLILRAGIKDLIELRSSNSTNAGTQQQQQQVPVPEKFTKKYDSMFSNLKKKQSMTKIFRIDEDVELSSEEKDVPVVTKTYSIPELIRDSNSEYLKNSQLTIDINNSFDRSEYDQSESITDQEDLRLNENLYKTRIIQRITRFSFSLIPRILPNNSKKQY